jgi:hypothetical protein
VLNELNHAKDPAALRYHVMAAKEGTKIKERLSLPAEKLFILVGGWGGGAHSRTAQTPQYGCTVMRAHTAWMWLSNWSRHLKSCVFLGDLSAPQLNDALADKPSELLDYSLKQEQTRLLVVGHRIAKCMAK